MNIKLLYTIVIASLAFTSCSKKDDSYNGETSVFAPPDMSDTSPTGLKVKSMYETYNVIFRPTFTFQEYSWNWSARITQTDANVTGTRYTPADPQYVIPVIDSVEKWVFNIFPAAFAKKNLPLNILLADSMGNKFTSGTTVVQRPYEAFLSYNYVLLPYVSARFEAEKTKRKLREAWLSIFIEKMLTILPPITEFSKHSTDGYAKITFTNAEDVQALYGILKKGRTKQNSSLATAAWNSTKPAQDFGDFVAFIVYTPQSEKETIYTKNTKIKIKENLVKAYFKDNFDITLPYIPIAP